jgi:hypothetical protein
MSLHQGQVDEATLVSILLEAAKTQGHDAHRRLRFAHLLHKRVLSQTVALLLVGSRSSVSDGLATLAEAVAFALVVLGGSLAFCTMVRRIRRQGQGVRASLCLASRSRAFILVVITAVVAVTITVGDNAVGALDEAR